MKTLLRTVLLVIVLFGLALAAEEIGPLKQLSVYLAQHLQPYTTIAIALAVAGWVLLGGAFALGLRTRGRPMSEDEARRFARPGGLVGRFSGWAAGSDFEMEMTFRGYKKAIRSGSAWKNSGWWITTSPKEGRPEASRKAGRARRGYFAEASATVNLW